jgi:hypothetical protein
MVRVLAIGHKVCGFKDGREPWIFKGEKFPKTPSFEKEVKSSSHVVIFYGMLKDSSKSVRDTS